jgi:hypothetical protein
MMKKNIITTITVLLFAASPLALRGQSLFPDLGGQRAGISGFQFLKIPTTAQTAALAEAGMTTISDASSIYINPALAVDVKRADASFSYASWFAQLRHLSSTAVLKLSPNDALGVGVIALTTSPIDYTTEFDQNTGQTFNYGDFLTSLTYSKRLTAEFSFGVTAKYIRQTLASVYVNAYLVDVGLCYKVPVEKINLRLAALLQNFGNSSIPQGVGSNYRISLNDGNFVALPNTVTAFEKIDPPTFFRLAISLDALSNATNRLTTFLQLNHPNDNTETLTFAGEYAWREVFFLRAGYQLGKDEKNFPDVGFGVQQSIGFAKMRVDYAFVNFATLGGTHRITVGLGGF